ncbi:MAG: hypothetical protein J6V81_02070 [Bacteroidales bacterium]|nr:hypothetical protein [Bacteroidales bacterium]
MQNLKCNFSGIYLLEDFLDGTILDFTGLEETRCYCSRQSADIIRAALAPYGPGGLHWIDSGDYHYVSLFIQEMIDEPYSLVLFDHHPDDQAGAFGQELLSCGSWVSEVHRLKNWRQSAENVYISIDKDVLSKEFALTDWDQGDMTLDELFASIRDISLNHRIIGVDICGEPSVLDGTCSEDVSINSKTNRLIQEFLLNLPGFELHTNKL